MASVISALRPRQLFFPLVRMGDDGDGGYLVPESVSNLKFFFSAGIGDNWSFESALSAFGIEVHALDGSINRPEKLPSEIQFQSLWLSGTSDSDAKKISLHDWVVGVQPDNRFGLKLDVEGEEFITLLQAPDFLLERCDVLVVEFHHLISAYSPLGNQMIRATLEKLQQFFMPVHAHPNNCSEPVLSDGVWVPNQMEVTFINKSQLGNSTFDFAELPHKHDRPNCKTRRDFAIW